MTGVRVEGHQQLLRRLDAIKFGLVKVVSNERVEQFMVRRAKDRLDRGVEPDGRAFAPLAQRTILIKKSLAAQGRIKSSDIDKPLLRSRTMREAITIVRRNTRVGANTGMGFSVGIPNDSPAAKYALKHQQGKGVTRRRFIGVSNNDAKALTALMRRELDKLVNRSE